MQRQQRFDWHGKTAGWNWLCHAIYVLKEAKLGDVRVSKSLQVPASLRLQFAWTRAEIKHTPCAPNNNPSPPRHVSLNNFPPNHLPRYSPPPPIASWNCPRLPRAAIRIYRVFCVALPSCESVYKTRFCSVMCGACIMLGFYMEVCVCVSLIKITP